MSDTLWECSRSSMNRNYRGKCAEFDFYFCSMTGLLLFPSFSITLCLLCLQSKLSQFSLSQGQGGRMN